VKTLIIQPYLYVALAIENKKSSVVHNYKPRFNCAQLNWNLQKV